MPPESRPLTELIAAVSRRGIVLLTAEGAILAYPEAQLTAAERAIIRQRRAELIPLLAEAVKVA